MGPADVHSEPILTLLKLKKQENRLCLRWKEALSLSEIILVFMRKIKAALEVKKKHTT